MSAIAPDSPGVKLPPPLIFAAGFLLGVALQLLLRLPALAGGWTVAGGVTMAVGGGALAGSAVILFRRSGTHLDPSKPARALVTTGPYRVTRNPIYLGFTLVYLAVALWTGSTGSLILLLVVLMVVDRTVVRREEAYLDRALGDDYRRYRQTVRRWL